MQSRRNKNYHSGFLYSLHYFCMGSVAFTAFIGAAISDTLAERREKIAKK
jgi:hypothetical protein